jgi:hypothetical protein
MFYKSSSLPLLSLIVYSKTLEMNMIIPSARKPDHQITSSALALTRIRALLLLPPRSQTKKGALRLPARC